MKQISCGVVILNNRRILACKPYGRKLHSGYDIPKGRAEEGETPIQTALRELKEETGIVLLERDLEPLGQFSYTNKKDLILFRTRVTINIDRCRCISTFDINGKYFPEVVGYKWIGRKDIDKFYLSLQDILAPILEKEYEDVE